MVENQKTLLDIPYSGVKTLEWDHSCSSVKITANTAGEESFVVVKVGNSLELENEAKLRIKGSVEARLGAATQPDLCLLWHLCRPDETETLPTKRANLSTRPQGKLLP